MIFLEQNITSIAYRRLNTQWQKWMLVSGFPAAVQNQALGGRRWAGEDGAAGWLWWPVCPASGPTSPFCSTCRYPIQHNQRQLGDLQGHHLPTMCSIYPYNLHGKWTSLMILAVFSPDPKNLQTYLCCYRKVSAEKYIQERAWASYCTPILICLHAIGQISVFPYCRSGEALEQVAQRSCGYAIPGSVQGFQQLGLVASVPGLW